MITIRLSMNGDVPMMLPVSGSRNGAPDGSVSSSTPARAPRKAMPAQRSPRESCSGVTPSKVSGWSRSSSPDGAKAGS